MQAASDRRDLRPAEAPDIAGSGWISTAGDVWLKTTNIGVIGNPFTALSSDPSAQWPGPSGVEHLYFVGLWVGAKDRTSADPNRLRRVSHNTEWRPPTLGPADRIYESREGAEGGVRLVDDDGDGAIDEDHLDGHDNDGDGLVDEDYAAISQEMFSCVLRDDTQEAQAVAGLEVHEALGLEVHQNTYAFSMEGERGYTAVEWTVRNVTDHVLDSVYVAFFVDQDVGPIGEGRHYLDDLVETRVPQGPDPLWPLPDHPLDDPENPNHAYVEFVPPDDPRYQATARCPPAGPEYCPCSRDVISLHGFTLIDDDGDDGLSPGASTFLLLDHTIDGRGLRAPIAVSFRMFDYFRPGVPFSQGGLPTNDQERYQLISSRRNVQGGRITAPPATEPDDYVAICSVGPFPSLGPGESVQVTWALVVAPIDRTAPADDLPRRYAAVIANAQAAQRNYRGVYEVHPEFPSPDSAQYGRETPLSAPPGSAGFYESDCRDFETERFLIPGGRTKWFDFDCNVCTGVPGHVLRRWRLQSGPPVLPTVERVPGDRRVSLLWDNRSEYTPDPGTETFDTKGYTIWRATGWSRDLGSIGPRDDEWALMATYHLYDQENPLIELVFDPGSGQFVPVETADVLVNRAWQPDNPFPARIYPQPVPCVTRPDGTCDTTFAKKPSRKQRKTLENYPVAHWQTGYYEFLDRPVQNGFLYFYAVVPFDSTGIGASVMSESARRAAREADAVVPQSGVGTAGSVPYVVPNPYRGGAAWDLTPTPADPTGTHVDFVQLPLGWTSVRIYTASGDLVSEIRPDDVQTNGQPQRETPEDGQASWNLVSRNGQEVASGIYLFSVEAPNGVQQGKFVVIR